MKTVSIDPCSSATVRVHLNLWPSGDLQAFEFQPHLVVLSRVVEDPERAQEWEEGPDDMLLSSVPVSYTRPAEWRLQVRRPASAIVARSIRPEHPLSEDEKRLLLEACATCLR